MADPLDKATAKAPATVGEGCLSRYDPEEMTAEDGTEFPGAAELWEALHAAPEALALPAELTPTGETRPPEIKPANKPPRSGS